MRIRIITVCILMITIKALSQPPKEFVVKPGETARRAFPFNEKYRLPQFETGFLITMKGQRSQSFKLNFNVLESDPEFIDRNGDTLVVEKGLAKYIQMGGLTYLHEGNDYFEVILKTQPVKLAVKSAWTLERIETLDGDGKKSISRDKSNAIYSPTHAKMIRNENIVYRKDSSYYFLDNKEKPFKANKANVLKLFPSHKDKIEEFIKQSRIDFKKEEGLRKLFDFCIPLGATK